MKVWDAKKQKYVSPEEYNAPSWWMKIIIWIVALVIVLFFLAMGFILSIGGYVILAKFIAEAIK